MERAGLWRGSQWQSEAREPLVLGHEASSGGRSTHPASRTRGSGRTKAGVPTRLPWRHDGALRLNKAVSDSQSVADGDAVLSAARPLLRAARLLGMAPVVTARVEGAEGLRPSLGWRIYSGTLTVLLAGWMAAALYTTAPRPDRLGEGGSGAWG